MRSDRTMPSKLYCGPKKDTKRKWGEPCPVTPKPPKPPKPPEPPRAPLPAWVPSGVDFHKLPGTVQETLARIVAPLYEQLVLQAPCALARATGMTLVQMAWLEAVLQFRLGRTTEEVCRESRTQLGDLHDLTEHFLRLAAAQGRTGSYWMRIVHNAQVAAQQAIGPAAAANVPNSPVAAQQAREETAANVPNAPVAAQQAAAEAAAPISEEAGPVDQTSPADRREGFSPPRVEDDAANEGSSASRECGRKPPLHRAAEGRNPQSAAQQACEEAAAFPSLKLGNLMDVKAAKMA